MLGQAALAMWWDMAPDMRAEFEHWHTHEHFPERLGIPGFLRATRWADAGGGEGFFILYDLQAWETLASPAYLARLNAPSDWSRRLMPHHRNMVRSQCRVLASAGSAVGAHALTIRLAPAPGADAKLLAHIRALLPALAQRDGVGGAHLLRTEAPAIAPTTEQAIRGMADRAADWILVVVAYAGGALDALRAEALADPALGEQGAAAGSVAGRYALRLSMVQAEAPTAPA